MPSVPFKLIDALATTAATKGTGVGIPPTPARTPRSITWQSIPTGGPSAISLAIEVAMNDVDTEYSSVDTSTVTAGELKTINNVNAKFIRARQISRTGGTDITIQVLIG